MQVVKHAAELDKSLVRPVVKHTKSLTLHRYLGFDNEFIKLPGTASGAWRLRSQPHCWVCGQRIYSILLWNQSIGRLQGRELKNSEQVLKIIKGVNKRYFAERE
jgi:hypothetical protein